MQNRVSSALRLLLYTNIWVALCMAVLMSGFVYAHRIAHPWPYGIFAFTATYATYNFHRYIRLKHFKEHNSTNARLLWMLRKRLLLQILFALAVIGSCVSICIIKPSMTQLSLLAIAGIIILLYPLRLPFVKKGLREVPFLKIVFIAGIWTITALFPIAEKPVDELLIPALMVFCATAAQVIPFDIRDITYDMASMHTIPQMLGVNGARIFATLLIFGVCWTISQMVVNPFYTLFYLTSALLSCWLPIRQKNLLWLEFLWELPLLIAGVVLFV